MTTATTTTATTTMTTMTTTTSTNTNTNTNTNTISTTNGPPLLLASVAVILTIATDVSSSENKSWVLLAVLSVIGKVSASAYVAEWWVDRKIQQSQSQQLFALPDRRSGAALYRSRLLWWVVVAPSISLSVLLFVRLLAIEHFSTDPPALDFGPKYGKNDNDAEPNTSFGGGSSIYHWAQGFVATLGASVCVLSLRLGGPRWSGLLLECLAFAGTGYPSYNLIKRMVKTPEALATSSYMNNGCEWALGAMVGMAFGMALHAGAKLWHYYTKSRENNANNNDDDEEFQGNYNKASDHQDSNYDQATTTTTRPPLWTRLLVVPFQLIGGFFVVSVPAACVLTGMTWNNCLPEDENECLNYNEEGIPIGITAGLGMIPIAVSIFGMLWSRALLLGISLGILVGVVAGFVWVLEE